MSYTIHEFIWGCNLTWKTQNKSSKGRECHNEVKRKSHTNSNEIWITALVCVYHNAHLHGKSFLFPTHLKLMHALSLSCPRSYYRWQHCHEILTIRFFFSCSILTTKIFMHINFTTKLGWCDRFEELHPQCEMVVSGRTRSAFGYSVASSEIRDHLETLI